jgi:AcrR family transcriptional regulator
MRPSTLEKRQKIIKVATQLFFENGFSETSLDQIIKQCGGSKLTLYRYFGDKKGILNEVIISCTDKVVNIFKFDTDADIPPNQQLTQFGYAYLEILLSPDIINMNRIVIAESRNDPQIGNFLLSKGPHQMKDNLIKYIQSQIEKETLKLDNPERACNQLLGLLRASYFSEALVGMKKPTAKEVQQHVDDSIHFFLKHIS